MMSALSCLVSITLAALGGLHIYWALGGRWAGDVAIPTREDGGPVFTPGPWACIAVALGLFGIAGFCLMRLWLTEHLQFETGAYWSLATIFALRVIGDFHYVGFFRKVKHTRFAHMDRLLYSPLCMVYSAVFAVLAMG